MEYIKSFLFLIMVVSILNNLSPSEDYKKYIKFFISLLLVISIVKPILSIINTRDFSSVLGQSYKSVNQFEEEINTGNVNVNALITSEYKNNLINTIEKTIEEKYYVNSSVSLNINEDSSSEEYGTIKDIDIVIDTNSESKKNKIKNYINLAYLVNDSNINIKTKEVR